jgi:hypothetical protein
VCRSSFGEERRRHRDGAATFSAATGEGEGKKKVAVTAEPHIEEEISEKFDLESK